MKQYYVKRIENTIGLTVAVTSVAIWLTLFVLSNLTPDIDFVLSNDHTFLVKRSYEIEDLSSLWKLGWQRIPSFFPELAISIASRLFESNPIRAVSYYYSTCCFILITACLIASLSIGRYLDQSRRLASSVAAILFVWITAYVFYFNSSDFVQYLTWMSIIPTNHGGNVINTLLFVPFLFASTTYQGSKVFWGCTAAFLIAAMQSNPLFGLYILVPVVLVRIRVLMGRGLVSINSMATPEGYLSVQRVRSLTRLITRSLVSDPWFIVAFLGLVLGILFNRTLLIDPSGTLSQSYSYFIYRIKYLATMLLHGENWAIWVIPSAALFLLTLTAQKNGRFCFELYKKFDWTNSSITPMAYLQFILFFQLMLILPMYIVFPTIDPGKSGIRYFMPCFFLGICTLISTTGNFLKRVLSSRRTRVRILSNSIAMSIALALTINLIQDVRYYAEPISASRISGYDRLVEARRVADHAKMLYDRDKTYGLVVNPIFQDLSVNMFFEHFKSVVNEVASDGTPIILHGRHYGDYLMSKKTILLRNPNIITAEDIKDYRFVATSKENSKLIAARIGTPSDAIDIGENIILIYNKGKINEYLANWFSHEVTFTTRFNKLLRFLRF